MRRIPFVLALLGAWIVLGVAAFAQKHEKHNKNDDYRIFTDNQRRDISACLVNERSGLPPGLAKKEHLPPGLERQLERNGHLPPGLEKKVSALPTHCQVNLPRLPDGWRRVVLSDRVIILDAARVISDIFQIVHDVKGHH